MICNCTDKWPVLMDDRAQVGVQLPTLADNVALLTFADELRAVATSLSTRRPPPINITELSSKPSTYHGWGQVMAQTDGQTPDHFIDPTPHTVSSVKIHININKQLQKQHLIKQTVKMHNASAICTQIQAITYRCCGRLTDDQ